MKHILFFILILSSCTKNNNIYYNKTTQTSCIYNKWDGVYTTIGHKGTNWLFTDTLTLSCNTYQATLIFPQQTTINNLITYWKAPNNCNISEFQMQNENIGVLLTHYIVCSDTLTDYICNHTNDTLGIKYYKTL